MEMEGASRANGAPIGGREEEGLSTGASTSRSLSPPSHAGGGGRRFLVGEVGSDHIRNELSTKPPKKVFEEIQHSYGLQLPQDEKRSELPVLDLLDLHKVSRAEVYVSVLSQLRAKLTDRIDSLPIDGLERLLETTFPYIGLEELRDIPLAILKRHPNIPATYLRRIGAKPEIYAICPIQVQRQIWQIDEELFKGRVFPLLNQYINTELDAPINEMLISTDDLVAPRRRRELNYILQQLVEIVGKSVGLYNKMLHFFRTLFVTNRDLHFCSLRSELLMALHDRGVTDIYDVDPCHKFAWCMDACVRDHIVEERRIKEMQTYFDAIPAGDPVLGDLAMIINDPNCTNTLLTNIFNLLNEIVDQEKLPSENANLKYIAQLLSLGLLARDIIEHQNFEIPEADTEVLRTFFPIMARKMLEDMVAEEDEPASELDPDFEAIFKSNALARKVALYYVLTRVQAKDADSVKQVLDKIDRAILADEPCFVQSLVTQLLATNDKAMHTLVVDEFLVRHIHASPTTHKQFLRYLLARHTRFSSQEIINYLRQATSDVRDRDKVRPVYEVLLDRVADRVHEHNAPFLFEYLGIKREAHPTDDGYIDEDHHYPPRDEDHHRQQHEQQQQQREEHEPEAEMRDAREEARGGEAAAEEREAAEAQDAPTSAVEEETKEAMPPPAAAAPSPEGPIQAPKEEVVEEGEQESGHHRGEMDVETPAAPDDTVA